MAASRSRTNFASDQRPSTNDQEPMKTTTEPNTLTSATYEELVREMIVRLGEDPDREGLSRTPARVHKAMQFLVKGYKDDPEALLRKALFTVNYDEMVIVKDVEMFSLCEHHLLPFFGKVHVAYIPNGKVIGLSKIPRLIEIFSRRLQIQERLTTQIAEAIPKTIEPQGVGVVIEARHLCMTMRGVEQQHSSALCWRSQPGSVTGAKSPPGNLCAQYCACWL